jgi:hypothetical protein
LESALQERAEQLKVKHDMKEKWKKREMGWHELMLKDTKALIALENDKVKAEYQKRVELGRARKKQVSIYPPSFDFSMFKAKIQSISWYYRQMS